MSELELSPLDTDGPELSCAYIDGVISRFPEAKNTMEYIRIINSQLRYDANGYKEIYLSLKKAYDTILAENAELKKQRDEWKDRWNAMADDAEEFKNKLDIAKDALKFYADRKNWHTIAFRNDYPMISHTDVAGPGGLVGGKLAREALARLEK